MRLSWFIVLILAATSSAWAQNQARVVLITGTVLDPSGSYVSGASVTLKRNAEVFASAKSDGSGRFRFEAVPRGNYSLETKQEGFDLKA